MKPLILPLRFSTPLPVYLVPVPEGPKWGLVNQVLNEGFPKNTITLFRECDNDGQCTPILQGHSVEDLDCR